MVSGKKIETKTFFVIAPIKLSRFWWNLVHHFLNKFAAKSCKQFQETVYHISSELPQFYQRYYKKTCWSHFFSRHTIHYKYKI